MPNPYKMGGSHTCLHAGFVTHLLAFVLHFCASGVVEVKPKMRQEGHTCGGDCAMFVCTHVGSRLAQEMGLGKVSFLEVRKESTRDTLTNSLPFRGASHTAYSPSQSDIPGRAQHLASPLVLQCHPRQQRLVISFHTHCFCTSLYNFCIMRYIC